MAMGQMAKALVVAGLAEEPKEKHKRGKQFTCHKCGSPMVKIEGTNIMVCSNEKPHKNGYFIFDKR